MKFSELIVGNILEFGSYLVTEAEVLEFARRYDPQPFHTDKNYASRWGGLIASGFHTCGIAMRLIVDNVLAGSQSIGSPGLSYVKWPNPVRPGDALRLRAEILNVERSASGSVGSLLWQWQLLNQRGESVLEVRATSLFDLAHPPLETGGDAT